MLLRVCQEDGIALVNVVRREAHVDLLNAMGAKHVCNSSLPTFLDDLCAALRETGAMVAFDAIGGGTLASELLFAMETVAVGRAAQFSPFGSAEEKRVYLYGRLDPGPIVIPPRPYGFTWGLDGWSMPPVLARAGPDRSAAMLRRVLDSLTSTFASPFGRVLSLADALTRDAMETYSSISTGQKCLIDPWQ
jgi:hypothetical protein